MILYLLLSLAAPSQECDDREGDVAAAECWDTAYRKADAQLNRVWPGVLAEARAADKRFRPTPRRDRPGAGNDLLASQPAWLAFRNAQCAAEAGWAQGGSLEPVLVGRCLTLMTRERVLKLKDIQSGFKEP
ncbi:lysozyme inhibitor LprI family protein [Sphingomonas sp. CBMAI 2297]|uniref:lysozyme inhibitor LprI family protein n=1 Tax=Sphingomonas sp. CBMAI 2297 TaxID=2991720 RepID=UPI0024567DA4|nr:lysozyme inhibitor LprI family protein [Sphingomonas sp. CBMAI 2297]MDH4743837.1 lysozyme inhibitor LprI family protein [Sphingomonas sp. CBMAI 2297]